MDDPRYRRLGPTADVGGCAGDAPVAGSPPKNGVTMLAIPWATSSTLGLCLSPLIRFSDYAESSDSIAPAGATVKAGVSSAFIMSK